MSLADQIEKRKMLYNTRTNTFDDFPVGTRVRVITLAQDYMFFRGNETGTVVKNSKEYLGIIVKFDEPILFEDGTLLEQWNFNPDDLIHLVVLEKFQDGQKLEEVISVRKCCYLCTYCGSFHNEFEENYRCKKVEYKVITNPYKNSCPEFVLNPVFRPDS